MAIKIAIAITLLLVGPVMSWIGDVPGVSSLPTDCGKPKNVRDRTGVDLSHQRDGLHALFDAARAHRAMRERLAARGAAAKTA